MEKSEPNEPQSGSTTWSASITEEEGPFRIYAEVRLLGNDCLVTVWGGTIPHIGAIGMAQVRPSLQDPGKAAATSSVFTYPAHKEDTVAKLMSEELARTLERNTVVVAGIHWDNLSEDDIKAIIQLCRRLIERIKAEVKSSPAARLPVPAFIH